jgi:hypothetical protein
MIDPTLLNKINTIPIFDVMNIRGYCVYIEGVLRTFVFAEDIAREAGLTRINKKTYAPTSVRADEEYEYETTLWQRFNEYVHLSIESFSRLNPDILPLIQFPLHRYSYIPIELALVVLMHCKSKKALDFQVILASRIIPEIQQHAIGYYEEIINNQQSEIFQCEEKLDRYRDYTSSLEEDIEKLGNRRPNIRRY